MSEQTALPAHPSGHHPLRHDEARHSETSMSSVPAPDSFVGRLARFFPDATPVRIPVRITGGELGGMSLGENTIIEYGTPHEVLFASSLPLEFADRLQLRNADDSLHAEVLVVAVQYQGGRTAVAARFVKEVANWIVKAG